MIPRKSTHFTKLYFAAAFFAILFLAGQACKKESAVGSTLLTDDDLLHATLIDTFTVDAYTLQKDMILTDGIPKMALGTFNDPDFGITRAQIFSQFLLPKTNYSFGTTPIIDSVVLSLHVDNIYGSKSQASTFKVYKVDALFKAADNSYSSNDTIAYSTELGSSSISADTGKVSIKLDNAFGTSLLAAASADLESNTKFVNFFKGISVKAYTAALNSGEGALYLINMTNASTNLSLYYHNSAGSASLTLTVPKTAKRFANYKQDYSNTTGLQAQLADKSLGKTQLYLQSLKGTKVCVNIPHIAQWAKGKKIMLNRAELIFPLQGGSNSLYALPDGASIYKDSMGITTELPDQFDFDHSHQGVKSPASGIAYGTAAIYYGGAYETNMNSYPNVTGYRFLITRYLQKKITNEENITTLQLNVASNAYSLGRAILNGGDINTSNRIKLLVYYTYK